ncbi:uncharacterized protein KQ657_003042 [Scheffersomyces spartinae]|uniref:Zn(2)-C6 fungal-type domain-containing protein n=1 Tax=Scheffersomyces spartinae TaxID=45513 RepID=A0A9P7V5A6_9ASCO|nr:uncharacterized protein KQ657_003042 [Scheffersomyces spartinae]KAG7191537.1 hypothetical protein KQ657_003042 [Scheffersomyces spartinae]
MTNAVAFSATDPGKFKRAYRACLNCRLRKVKCDLGPADSPRQGKCARCLRERKDCVFIERKRSHMETGSEIVTTPVKPLTGTRVILRDSVDGGGKMQLVAASSSLRYNNNNNNINTGGGKLAVSQMLNHEGQEERDAVEKTRGSISGGGTGNDEGSTGGEEPEFTSHMGGALAFLANAAGSMASADERDNIDAKERALQIEQIDRSSSQTPSQREGAAETTTGNVDDGNVDNNNINNDNFVGTGSGLGSGGGSGSGSGSGSCSGSGSRTGSRTGSQSDLGGDSSTNGKKHSIPPLLNHLKHGRMIMPPAESIFATRPKAADSLGNIEYIGPLSEGGILTVEEAQRLINLFFTTMHPFFPHLPIFLRNPDILPQYPILLCAIITIASRYHPFENNVGNSLIPRHIEVHDRLWLYVQRLISQTVWAEASTRSIGTVFAFLLFTEWNPRAIHWRWADYANKAEDEGSSNSTTASTITNTEKPRGNSGGSSNASNHYEQNLAGFGAMRRSDRMGWMLIGSAVRLAQDMGFMDVSAKTFLATHIAEINSVMNISRRSMLAQSLLEIEVDDDDDDEDDNDIDNEGASKDASLFDNDNEDNYSGHKRKRKSNSSKYVEEDFDSKVFTLTEEAMRRFAAENTIKFTKPQRAQIELLQIMSLGHESLYGYKARLGELTQRQSLSVLSILSPLISSWGRKYRLLLVPITPKFQKYSQSVLQKSLLDQNSKVAVQLQDALLRESFIFEYNYLKLYIYSLALSPTKVDSNPTTATTSHNNSDGDNNSNATTTNGTSSKRRKKTVSKYLKLEEMANSTKYIEQAFNAASEMLNVANRVHRLKLLRYMPTRWLTRIVRAIAFIVKCYMTITAHKKSNNSQNQQMAFDVTVLSLSLITIEEIMHSIQRAALCLRDSSPDELHLCTRYSNILMFLYSQMKSKSKSLGVSVGPVRTTGKQQQQQSPSRPRENEHMSTTRTTTMATANSATPRVNDELRGRHSYGMPTGASGFNVEGTNFFDSSQQQLPPIPPIEYAAPTYPEQYEMFEPSPQQQQMHQLQQMQQLQQPAQLQQRQQVQQPAQLQVFSFPSLFDRVEPGPSHSTLPSDGTNSPVSGMFDEPVMEWLRNEHTIGLEFVGPWTEMIEQRLDANETFAFGEF